LEVCVTTVRVGRKSGVVVGDMSRDRDDDGIAVSVSVVIVDGCGGSSIGSLFVYIPQRVTVYLYIYICSSNRNVTMNNLTF
jgi:hypothetical protein